MKYMYVMYGRKQISLNNVPINIIPTFPPQELSRIWLFKNQILCPQGNNYGRISMQYGWNTL